MRTAKFAVSSVCMMAFGRASVPEVKMSSDTAEAGTAAESRGPRDRPLEGLVEAHVAATLRTEHDVAGSNASAAKQTSEIIGRKSQSWWIAGVTMTLGAAVWKTCVSSCAR